MPDTQTQRYIRQTALDAVGKVGQNRLGEARIAIVGMGGLGCPAAMVLAGAGIGTLRLIDADTVSVHNLHRQPLYAMASLGQFKVEAARERLSGYNPDITIDISRESLTPENAHRLLNGVDIVIAATDRLLATYLMSDVCHHEHIPLVAASALEEKGYAGVFCKTAPTYRDVFPDMPSVAGSCAENGVLGSLTMMVGALQAHLALQILLDHEPSPLGKLISLDLKRLTFGGFSFVDMMSAHEATPAIVHPDRVTGTDRVFDMRGEAEAFELILPQAQRLSFDEVDTIDISKTSRLVFACATGVRAWRAARLASRHGYETAVLMTDQAAALAKSSST